MDCKTHPADIDALELSANADVLRQTMLSTLNQTLTHVREYTRHGNALLRAGMDLPHTDHLTTRSKLMDVFEEVLHEYSHNKKCQVAPDSLATIELPTECYQKTLTSMHSFHFSRLLDDEGLSRARTAVSKLVDRINWQTLARKIDEDAKNVEARGHWMRCDALSEGLRTILLADKPVITSGTYRLILPSVMEGYPRRSNTLRYELAEHLEVLDGLYGTQLSGGAFHLTTTIQHLSFNDSVPYRSCYGKGSDLEWWCFKSKTELRMTRKGFDALHAYMMRWGDEGHQWQMRTIADATFTD